MNRRLAHEAIEDCVGCGDAGRATLVWVVADGTKDLEGREDFTLEKGFDHVNPCGFRDLLEALAEPGLTGDRGDRLRGDPDNLADLLAGPTGSDKVRDSDVLRPFVLDDGRNGLTAGIYRVQHLGGLFEPPVLPELDRPAVDVS